jgi:hypothetical protein
MIGDEMNNYQNVRKNKKKFERILRKNFFRRKENKNEINLK